MSATDPSMANLMGGRLQSHPVSPPPPPTDSDMLIVPFSHDLSTVSKRAILTGFALNGLAAACGLNAPSADVARKAVQLADAVMAELDRRK